LFSSGYRHFLRVGTRLKIYIKDSIEVLYRGVQQGRLVCQRSRATWSAEGAKSLALTGDVRCEQLANLFDGLTPDGSNPLVKMGGQEHKHRSG